MKLIFIILAFAMILTQSCSVREREKQIEQKLSEVSQKEQELLLKEKTLQLREEELSRREHALDSSKALAASDSAFIYNPAIVGNWSVRMNCTETTCAGSAVGDTKLENWEIVYQGDAVIARAQAGKELVRIYTGRYLGNTLQLTAQQQDTTANQVTRMVVRIQEVRKNEWVGRREIIRPEDCRIIYSLELKKL